MGVVDRTVRTGWHWEFGWLRRRDLDNQNGYCYEEPDGDQVYFPNETAKNMVLLDQRIDSVTGEAYVCMSGGRVSRALGEKLAKRCIKFRLWLRQTNDG